MCSSSVVSFRIAGLNCDSSLLGPNVVFLHGPLLDSTCGQYLFGTSLCFYMDLYFILLCFYDQSILGLFLYSFVYLYLILLCVLLLVLTRAIFIFLLFTSVYCVHYDQSLLGPLLCSYMGIMQTVLVYNTCSLLQNIMQIVLEYNACNLLQNIIRQSWCIIHEICYNTYCKPWCIIPTAHNVEFVDSLGV